MMCCLLWVQAFLSIAVAGVNVSEDGKFTVAVTKPDPMLLSFC